MPSRIPNLATATLRKRGGCPRRALVGFHCPFRRPRIRLPRPTRAPPRLARAGLNTPLPLLPPPRRHTPHAYPRCACAARAPPKQKGSLGRLGNAGALERCGAFARPSAARASSGGSTPHGVGHVATAFTPPSRGRLRGAPRTPRIHACAAPPAQRPACRRPCRRPSFARTPPAARPRAPAAPLAGMPGARWAVWMHSPLGRCPALRPQRPLRTLSVGARALPAPPPSMSRGAARSRGAAGPRPRGGRASRALPRGASQAKNLSLGLAPGRGRWRWEAAKSAQGRRSVCVAYSLCVATAL